MKHLDSRRLLSRQDVEQTFGISRRFLELSAGKSTGPRMVKIGRLVRYRVLDIEDWIEQNTSDGGRYE